MFYLVSKQLKSQHDTSDCDFSWFSLWAEPFLKKYLIKKKKKQQKNSDDSYVYSLEH